MKSPPLQFTDDEARELVEAFIRGDVDIKEAPRSARAASKTRKTAVQKNT
jgi:myo-inositol-1-phosphate synthase